MKYFLSPSFQVLAVSLWRLKHQCSRCPRISLCIKFLFLDAEMQGGHTKVSRTCLFNFCSRPPKHNPPTSKDAQDEEQSKTEEDMYQAKRNGKPAREQAWEELSPSKKHRITIEAKVFRILGFGVLGVFALHRWWHWLLPDPRRPRKILYSENVHCVSSVSHLL